MERVDNYEGMSYLTMASSESDHDPPSLIREVRMSAKQETVVTTDEKKAYLRQWALARSGSDPARLPTIREARIEVRRHFGTDAGAGLGTDIITKTLRDLREELGRARGVPPVGTVQVPGDVRATQMARMERIALIAFLMRQENIQSITIDNDAGILDLRGFPKLS